MDNTANYTPHYEHRGDEESGNFHEFTGNSVNMDEQDKKQKEKKKKRKANRDIKLMLETKEDEKKKADLLEKQKLKREKIQ